MDGKYLSRTPAEPLPEEISKAARQPNGWIYRIAGVFAEHEAVPPEAIVGAWKVDKHGSIEGAFIPNPNFKPPDVDGTPARNL